MKTAVALPSYIEVDERGVPWITGTNTKVAEVVLDHQEAGWSPEQIHEHYPELSLAVIHAALSYYYEHRDAIDEWIRVSREEMEAFFAAQPPSPAIERLRAIRPHHQ